MILSLLITTIFAQAVFEAPKSNDGSFLVRLSTERDLIYVLEETPSLTTPWREQRLFKGTGAPVEITNAASVRSLFLRARVLPGVIISKPGVPLEISFAPSNTVAQWTMEGELPVGIQFASGRFFGTPTAEAAERSSTGNYTNILHFASSTSRQDDARVEIVHHVRLSYSKNLFPERTGGPSLGSICLHCHGSGFPPDFSPNATTLLQGKSGAGGTCPDGLRFVTPGDPASSLIYQKITSPQCGDRMPQGGPFFSQTEVDRVARWIRELQPSETD